MKTLEQNQREQIQKAIDTMAIDPYVIETVKEIEGKFATTKGHYGDYLAVLTLFVPQGKFSVHIMGEALIKAGANAYGVQSALNILILG